MAQFTTTLEKFDSNLWGYHFRVPTSIAKDYIDGNNRRVFCHVNGVLTLQCALMPDSEGYFILINKDQVNKYGFTTQENVSIKIEKDHSEFGHEVPESFNHLLAQDPEGSKYFDQLTPGKQRSLIYLVRKVKNVDSQLNKGLAIMDHLKSERGKLDFKKLNQLIKVYNQRSKLK